MDLNAWTQSGRDVVRMRRLGIGYAVGAVCLAGLFTFFALTARGEGSDEGEDAIDVELAQLPEEEKQNEPEPEPEPEPEQVSADPGQRAGPRAMAVPTAIPEDKPKEADAGSGTGSDPYQDAKRYGDGSTGKTRVGPPKRLAPPPELPKPRTDKPVRLTKDMTPPSPLAQGAPGYPKDAKANGVEGTVIVMYVVTESGDVTGVRAVRGPEELRAVCEAAVRNWRFKPAMLDGRPVSVKRTARFPFRIRT